MASAAPPRSFGRGEVHAQARARVDLDDRRGLAAAAGAAISREAWREQGSADVLEAQVDPADVQAGHGGGTAAQLGDFLVHLIGDILAGPAGRQIAVLPA